MAILIVATVIRISYSELLCTYTILIQLCLVNAFFVMYLKRQPIL